MVFQDPMTSAEPLYARLRSDGRGSDPSQGLTKRQAVAEAVRMLDAVRIPDAAARITMYPHEFSGGMRQRIMVGHGNCCAGRGA